jgi:hypothetical protein
MADPTFRLGIRAAYITGRYTREDALTRIENNAPVSLSHEEALAILAAPITPELVRGSTGQDVTEEQIAARLAEVGA